MTEPAQLRLNIDPVLREDFKAKCQSSGTSMAEQTSRMIAAFLDKSGSTKGDGATPANAGDGPSANEIVESPAEPQDPLSALLDKKLEPVLDALDACATMANIDWLSTNLINEVRTRHDELASSITSVDNRVAGRVETSHKSWQEVMTANRRDWYWLGGAALAGMVALALLLTAVSGTVAGRKVAIKLAGGDNRWHAALLLAGQGSALHGQLMNETRALLEDPAYRAKYADCIERAFRAKRNFVCKLVMSPLNRKRD